MSGEAWFVIGTFFVVAAIAAALLLDRVLPEGER